MFILYNIYNYIINNYILSLHNVLNNIYIIKTILNGTNIYSAMP